MGKEQLFKLYERLYFDEIERREKLDSRLQLPLAILIVIFGIIAYMLQNFSPSTSMPAVLFFWLIFSFACLSLLFSIFYFKRSWLGYKYRLLPTPEDSEKYRKACIDLYKEYKNFDELVNDAMHQYLFNAYVEYSSWNMANNDTKSLNLERTGKALFMTFIFCIITFIPFFLGGLDKSKKSIESETPVATTQIIKKKGEKE